MKLKEQEKTYARVVAEVADHLWTESPGGEWVPVWRLVPLIETQAVAEVRPLGLVIPGAADLPPDTIRNRLLDAALTLLVSKRRAELRTYEDVEDVRIGGCAPRGSSKKGKAGEAPRKPTRSSSGKPAQQDVAIEVAVPKPQTPGVRPEQSLAPPEDSTRLPVIPEGPGFAESEQRLDPLADPVCDPETVPETQCPIVAKQATG